MLWFCLSLCLTSDIKAGNCHFSVFWQRESGARFSLLVIGGLSSIVLFNPFPLAVCNFWSSFVQSLESSDTGRRRRFQFGQTFALIGAGDLLQPVNQQLKTVYCRSLKYHVLLLFQAFPVPICRFWSSFFQSLESGNRSRLDSQRAQFGRTIT